jgi:hypothetical protein
MAENANSPGVSLRRLLGGTMPWVSGLMSSRLSVHLCFTPDQSCRARMRAEEEGESRGGFTESEEASGR